MCAYILKNEPVGDQVIAAGRTADGQRNPVGGTLKRVVDVLGASVALVLLAPLMILTAVLVRLLLGGPVLLAQARVGFDGKIYSCYTFRTTLLGMENAPRDPRATCLGNVLGKLGIDQLPQLLNVLRGDMSLVGPQPVTSDEIGRYGHHAHEYLSARPGLVGLWQENERSDASYLGRIARDRYYAPHWSLRLDLLLLLTSIFRRQ